MDVVSAFIPMDRRHALAAQRDLPDHAAGAALLADLTGYTALTETLAAILGPQRGAEELTALLTPVFDALTAAIHRYHGSVLGFAGDALTAWFDDAGEPGAGSRRAATAALAMQAAMRTAGALVLPGGQTAALDLHCVLVAGPARRFLVGDPAIQQLDVLAGPVLARLAPLEGQAAAGELLLDSAAAAALAGAGPAGTPRLDATTGEELLVLTGLAAPAPPDPWPALPPGALPAAQLQPWLLPAVWARLQAAQGAFLTELRPVVALFLRFEGLDYERPASGARLDTYIRWVQGVLARYEAALLQVTIGDKGNYLYAAFGAPLAHSDDAARAMAAAIELRSPPPSCAFVRGIQIGIAGGLVRVGACGGEASRSYSAVGDAVNLAARLMQSAAPGGILVTREVRRGAGGGFRWANLPPLIVKGKREPVVVWGLIEATAEHGLGLLEPAYHTPLVGRAPELALLGARMAAAAAGQGQVVAIVGEAGLGKSRLLAAGVVQARATAGFVAYGGAAQSYGTHTAYLAWQPIWRTFFDLEPDGSPAEQTLQLEDALAAIDPALLPRLPLLGAVLGLPLPDTDLTAGLDVKLRKESLEALLVACLRARAQETPLLIVLEDGHWLDPLSHELLEALGRAIPRLPVLLLLAYRPPEVDHSPLAALTMLPHFTAIQLAGLTTDDAAGLIAAHLGAADPATVPRGLIAALAGRAEGNPFYLEELLQYLADQGRDPCDPEALAGLAWPASLQSLLLARIDQLAEEQRTVLKVASVVGRLFRLPQLWGVYPDLGTTEQVRAALGVLDRLGLTPLDSPAPEWVYLFKHIVTQEVAYGSLPFAQREQLHAQFAAWLEAGSRAAGTAPPVDLLAYHYAHSANRAKAREYTRRAAEAAAAAYANAAAVAYYEQLRDWTPPGEQGPVLLALGAVLERTGAWDRAASCYQEATHCDAALATPAALGLGTVRRQQGALPEAATWLEQARAGFAAARDPGGESAALAALGEVDRLQGNYAAARDRLQASLARAAAAADPHRRALALNNLGNLAVDQGDYPAARALYEESLALRRAIGDRAGVTTSLNNLGTVASAQGDYAAARLLYEESLALGRELGDRAGIAMALSNLAAVAGHQGDFAAAIALFEETLAVYRELGDRGQIAQLLSNLGFLACRRGDFAAARAMLDESLALARELGAPWRVAQAVGGLGEVAYVQGDYAEAHRLDAESLAICRELGYPRGIAWNLINLGQVAYAQGAYAEAAGLLEESLALFRDLGDRGGIATALPRLALVARATGDLPAAWARMAESLALAHELGAGEETHAALVVVAALLPPAAPAARLLGAVTHLLTTQHALLAPHLQQVYTATLAAARAALGAPACAAAFAAGEALPWEAALTEAQAAAPPAPTPA